MLFIFRMKQNIGYVIFCEDVSPLPAGKNLLEGGYCLEEAIVLCEKRFNP